jgi:hypothetical protein
MIDLSTSEYADGGSWLWGEGRVLDVSLMIFRQDGGLVTSSSRLSGRVPFVASRFD